MNGAYLWDDVNVSINGQTQEPKMDEEGDYYYEFTLDETQKTLEIAFVNSYVPQIDIIKTDSTDRTARLSGASFILTRDETVYSSQEMENENAADEGSVTTYYYTGSGWLESEEDAAFLTTDENGSVLAALSGVARSGTYTLKEVKAPEGYTRISDPIRFIVVDGMITPRRGSSEAVADVSSTAENTSLTLTVQDDPEPPPEDDTTPTKPDEPEPEASAGAATGDTASLFLWSCLVLMGTAGAVGILAFRKRRLL